MGFMDKIKKTADDAQQMAAGAVSSKLSEIEQNQTIKAEQKEQGKLAKAADKQEQEQLKRIYHVTNSMGDVSIDSGNRLFKVRRASADIPKTSGALMKTGKALAAVYTLGASVAIEHSMKPDDRIFGFDEVRSFELIEDDSQVVGGGVGMALVGGAFFGGAGAVAGSMVGGKKTKKTVDNLLLKINLKDIDFPCVIIPYITKTVKVTSNDYKKALGAAQQTISCLELIIDEVERMEASSAPAPEPTRIVVEQAAPTASTDDPIEAVKKLKELVDMGIISQDEFDAKKRELLGL